MRAGKPPSPHRSRVSFLDALFARRGLVVSISIPGREGFRASSDPGVNDCAALAAQNCPISYGAGHVALVFRYSATLLPVLCLVFYIGNINNPIRGEVVRIFSFADDARQAFEMVRNGASLKQIKAHVFGDAPAARFTEAQRRPLPRSRGLRRADALDHLQPQVIRP